MKNLTVYIAKQFSHPGKIPCDGSQLDFYAVLLLIK
jgi:hypothetical protein